MNLALMSNVIFEISCGGSSDIFRTETANRIDCQRCDVYFRDTSPVSPVFYRGWLMQSYIRALYFYVNTVNAAAAVLYAAYVSLPRKYWISVGKHKLFLEILLRV